MGVPVWSCETAPVSTGLNTGTLTPAILSTRISTRFWAVPTDSITIGLMSPAAYLTSARAKLPSFMAEPISSLACARQIPRPRRSAGSGGRATVRDEAGRTVRIFLSSKRRRMVSASAFFLSSEWPFLAPVSFTFITCRFCRVGKTARRAAPPPDMATSRLEGQPASGDAGEWRTGVNGRSAGTSPAQKKKRPAAGVTAPSRRLRDAIGGGGSHTSRKRFESATLGPQVALQRSNRLPLMRCLMSDTDGMVVK